jgi:hypothetical protein
MYNVKFAPPPHEPNMTKQWSNWPIKSSTPNGLEHTEPPGSTLGYQNLHQNWFLFENLSQSRKSVIGHLGVAMHNHSFPMGWKHCATLSTCSLSAWNFICLMTTNRMKSTVLGGIKRESRGIGRQFSRAVHLSGRSPFSSWLSVIILV